MEVTYEQQQQQQQQPFDPPRLKPSSSFADDTEELRRQGDLNLSVSLEDLAVRVRYDDSRTVPASVSERNRQVFGIVWLKKTCQLSPRNAIPRNRIYARYAEICARHKIKPLNPAAFGKLVKLVFPDIKTRRLGVRGKSKYHYCGINLIGDALVPIGSINNAGSAASADDFDIANDDSFENGQDSAASSSKANNNTSVAPQKENQNPQSTPQSRLQSLLFTTPPDKVRSSLDSPSSHLATTPLDPSALPPLHFSKKVMDSPAVSFNSLAFPSIDAFVPAGADKDAVDILTALCQSHCSALLEAIRFMHLKQFLNTLSSFHGTLTSPVQKLLAVPSILEWVQRCDWIMYKEMIHMLAPLALQVVPANVLTALRSLSMTLPQNILTSFRTLPPQFVQVKLRPAYAFSNLIGRLLRVTNSANAAARILANPNERKSMLADWINYVDARLIVLREAPCGGAMALKILTEDLIALLAVPAENIAANADHWGRPHSRDLNDVSTSPAPPSPTPGKDDMNDPGEGIIEQWAEYLTALPLRFPNVSARMFLLYMNGILTAALREITLNGGEAFGAWWMVRCWIDEWIAWVAEQGGFFDTDYLPIAEDAGGNGGLQASQAQTDKAEEEDQEQVEVDPLPPLTLPTTTSPSKQQQRRIDSSQDLEDLEPVADVSLADVRSTADYEDDILGRGPDLDLDVQAEIEKDASRR
ncbi:RFX DNA-binding domain-containing protein [Myxozyma melibiosi]|uniref:RFX DNA-binding domain-containing protein n=1 Tax=Myxozyma melibiosi TaxID=54550 RepID=A0ABR1EY64_9ASCO